MENKNAAFTRDDTNAIKGIAVIMMLLHHLAGFSSRFPIGFEGFYSKSEWFVNGGFLTSLALGMNLCIAFFYFLGGYGVFLRIQKGSFKLTENIFGLLKKYWKIFLIFIPVGFLFFSRSGEDVSALASRYNYENIRHLITMLISNFTMLSYYFNEEWWFMRIYICALLLGTVYVRLTKKLNSFSCEILIVIILDILSRSVLPDLPRIEAMSGLSSNFFFGRFVTDAATMSPFFMGIVFAKYNGIVRMKILSAVFRSVLYWGFSVRL